MKFRKKGMLSLVMSPLYLNIHLFFIDGVLKKRGADAAFLWNDLIVLTCWFGLMFPGLALTLHSLLIYTDLFGGGGL
jgi:hypothetical protein